MAEPKILFDVKELEDRKWHKLRKQLAYRLTRIGVLMDRLLAVVEHGQMKKI